MGYKKNTSLDQLEVPVSLEKFTKELPRRFEEGEFNDNRFERVDKELSGFNKSMKKQWTLGKRIGAFTLAAAASFLLFVGSGFVSPAMAKMISKIPPLSTIYEKHVVNLSEHITQELKKDGYPVREVTELVGGKNEGVYINLDASEEKIKEMKPGIEKIAYGILKGGEHKGTRIEDYFVKISKHVEPTEKWKQEQEAFDKESEEVHAIIQPILNAHGIMGGYGFGPETVELEFPSIENQDTIDGIKKELEAALKAGGKDFVSIKIRKYNLAKREQYDRWMDTVSAIGHEFKTYKKYQVSSVGYQSKDGLMRILIKIKLKSSDPKAEELASDLNLMIEDFIKSPDIWEKVEDDPYEIVITGKDGKQINK
jgi:hypothetical protein